MKQMQQSLDTVFILFSSVIDYCYLLFQLSHKLMIIRYCSSGLM